MTKKTPGKSTAKPRKPRKPKIIEHPLSSAVEFTNREIGWLNFNRRVLFEAEDSRTPVLERLRFLAISHSNLDEFFMKRVGGLKRQVAFGVSGKSSDGKTPQQQLIEIRTIAMQMVKDQAQCFSKAIKPALKEQNIHLIKWKDLDATEKEMAKKYYLKKKKLKVITKLKEVKLKVNKNIKTELIYQKMFLLIFQNFVITFQFQQKNQTVFVVVNFIQEINQLIKIGIRLNEKIFLFLKNLIN